MRKQRNTEKGAILPLFAILLPALVGALGLAVDTGSMYDETRRMQTAADAAAIAAAQELRVLNFSGYQTAAVTDASLNGYAPDADIDVEINRPPTTGPRSGNSAFVEVLIRREAPTYFMGIFVDHGASLTARAVAGVEPADSCIYALNPDEADSFDAGGSSHVQLDDCGIYVNSDHDAAAVATGSSNVSAASISVVGGSEGTGFYPEPFTGVPAQVDPLAEFEPPPWGTCDYTKQIIISEAATLDPGVYCGGLVATAQSNVTFNPGVYVIMGGGLTGHGGAHLAGDEVTFVFTEQNGKPYDGIWLNAGVSTDLNAPTIGPWKGILFYQDPEVTSSRNSILSGTASMELSGVIYFPTTEIQFSGTFGGQGQDIMVIADKVQFDGNSTFHKLGDEFIPNVLKFARVVE
jgi:hypothetical protein